MPQITLRWYVVTAFPKWFYKTCKGKYILTLGYQILLMGFNSPKLFYSLDSRQTEIVLLLFLFNSIKTELYFFSLMKSWPPSARTLNQNKHRSRSPSNSICFHSCCAGNVLCAHSQSGISTVYQVAQHNANIRVTDQPFPTAVRFLVYMSCHLQIRMFMSSIITLPGEDKGYFHYSQEDFRKKKCVKCCDILNSLRFILLHTSLQQNVLQQADVYRSVKHAH